MAKGRKKKLTGKKFTDSLQRIADAMGLDIDLSDPETKKVFAARLMQTMGGFANPEEPTEGGFGGIARR